MTNGANLLPSTSGNQHRFMAMASTAAGRAKLKREGKKVPPQNVAMDFRKADTGRHFSSTGVKRKNG